ncbi:MAG TPA: hypothetical protein VIL46_09720, partial [Gemmataceae bacterium]
MTDALLSAALHSIRSAAHPRAAERSDRDLLAAFARDRDEAAFAQLVRRHGPLVLGVCRRVAATRTTRRTPSRRPSW